MNFSKTYRRMNEPVGPSPDLIRKTLSHPDRHRLPLRRLAAAAAVAAVLLATPALAVRSETGYAVLYRIAPAVAQFFQPIQEACTDSGITMEVKEAGGSYTLTGITRNGQPLREDDTLTVTCLATTKQMTAVFADESRAVTDEGTWVKDAWRDYVSGGGAALAEPENYMTLR